jgi:hypothetical protein
VQTFLFTATSVAADYGFTRPPRFMSVCLLCDGTDKNCNFSAMHSLIELKLDGDLGLVSQISVHVLVSRFDCFSYCKQRNKKNENPAKIAKNMVLENLSFLRSSKSDYSETW